VRCGARNHMTTKHVTDLVWLYSNLRLAKRTKSLEEQDMAQPWVVLLEKERGGGGGGGVVQHGCIPFVLM